MAFEPGQGRGHPNPKRGGSDPKRGGRDPKRGGVLIVSIGVSLAMATLVALVGGSHGG